MKLYQLNMSSDSDPKKKNYICQVKFHLTSYNVESSALFVCFCFVLRFIPRHLLRISGSESSMLNELHFILQDGTHLPNLISETGSSNELLNFSCQRWALFTGYGGWLIGQSMIQQTMTYCRASWISKRLRVTRPTNFKTLSCHCITILKKQIKRWWPHSSDPSTVTILCPFNTPPSTTKS